MEQETVQSIAERVLRLPPERRAAGLQSACGQDAALREAVESYMRRHESVTIAPGTPTKTSHDRTDPNGAAIAEGGSFGNYRLLGMLGEGGMGVVYLAEQARTRQRVALKLVRAGFATPRMLRRFEAEVQALGRLDHPGIARIFEAGTHDTGLGPQPFFAMEYVQGTTLMEHVVANRPGVRERLAMIVEVCRAVQHAHTKGVIHRDLKPGNVLVDREGRVRVLDFGVARLSESDREATMHTEAGQVVGTIPYMSPEQLSGDPEGVDTRSDVYALGVMMYEVLSGRLPHDLATKTLVDAVRTVSENTPLPLRAIDPSLPGEVGIIALKALEKDRERRYQGPAELADDIERFLRDEPIVARPPSRVYLLRKFAKRHRMLVSASAAVILTMVAGVAGVVWQAVVATRERDRAVAAEILAEKRQVEAEREAATATAISDFLRTMLTSADPEKAMGRAVTVREVVDSAAATVGTSLKEMPVVEGTIRRMLAATYRSLGEWERSDAQYVLSENLLVEQLGKDSREALGVRRERGILMAEMGRFEEAEQAARESIERLTVQFGEEDAETVRAKLELPRAMIEQGKMAEAIEMFEKTIPIAERVIGKSDGAVLAARHNLGSSLRDFGRLADSERILREVLADRRRIQGAEHPETMYSLNSLAMTLARAGNMVEAEALTREALAGRRKLLGDQHPATITTMQNIVSLAAAQGRIDEAEPLAREALTLSEAAFGPDHPKTMSAVNMLAYILDDRGQLDEAEALYRRALQFVEKSSGQTHPETLPPLNNLAMLLQKMGRLEEAAEQFGELMKRADASLPPDHYLGAIFRNNFGDCLREMKRYDEAEAALTSSYEVMLKALGPAHARTKKAIERLALLEEARGDTAAATAWRDKAAAPGG